MSQRELVICVLSGGVLLVAGFFPSLLQSTMYGIQNFTAAIRNEPPADYNGEVRPQLWMKVVGASLIAVSVAAYVSN